MQTLLEVMAWLCRALALAHKADQEGNCILVFLSGMQEIEEVRARTCHVHSTAGTVELTYACTCAYRCTLSSLARPPAPARSLVEAPCPPQPLLHLLLQVLVMMRWNRKTRKSLLLDPL